MSTTHLEALYTPKEAAQYLRCDRDTIYKSLNDSRLRGIKVGRHWRIPESALAEFVHDNAA